MKPSATAGIFMFLAVAFFFAFGTFLPPGWSQTTAEVSSDGVARGLVLVIPVKDDIDSGLSFFIQRMIRRAERDQVKALVLEINSNGGLVNAAQEIKDALLACKVPTVAYIKGRALSAAALIAISCQKIAMEPGTEMGAATPIMLLGPQVQAAEPKFVSAFRGEFESAAEMRRRPTALAGAMVDKDHETIPGLVKRGEILTLTAETANSHGFCDVIASSLDYALLRLKIKPDPLERVEPTSGEVLARWLTNPNVSVMLFTIGVWSLILEFMVFGWGLLGWFGLVCLGLFFGGHFFAYLAGMEALLLFSAGMVLLFIEIFVTPGFGLIGVLGILAVCGSVILVFGGIYTAVFAVAKIFAMSLGMLMVLYVLGPKVGLFDRLVLKKQLTTEDGFVAVDMDRYSHLLKLEGITLSPCRPSGFVRFGNERIEVVSDGEFIERNKRVTAISVEGSKVVVRELNA